MGIDILPTLCAMAGIPNPEGVELDGRDISALLTQGAASPHEQLLLFNDEDVVAIRTQRWKYAVRFYYRGSLASTESVGYPELFDVSKDVSESYSVAAVQPEVLADMQERMKAARARFAPLKPSSYPRSSAIGCNNCSRSSCLRIDRARRFRVHRPCTISPFARGRAV